MKKSIASGVVALFVLAAGGATQALLASCGIFTDVSPAQCPFVLEMYYLGITAGTSATTFSPDANMTRGQAAVFVSKGIDAAIQRSSRRAALGQWWTTTPRFTAGLGVTALGPGNVSSGIVCDGAHVWVGKHS